MTPAIATRQHKGQRVRACDYPGAGFIRQRDIDRYGSYELARIARRVGRG